MSFELPDRIVRWFPSIDSTMTIAAQMAREGCPSGTVVGADQQTAGMGRQGRPWHSEPGAGLYVSIVLRLNLGREAIPLLMLALGVASQQAIAEVSGLAPDLRWPNDVLLDGKKCAGILANAEDGAIIAGIGINVSHESFPPELAGLATSLRLAGAPGVSREALLAALVQAVDESCKILTNEGPVAICEIFTHASSYAQGRRVRAEQDGIVGITCGINPSGFLVLRQDDGTESLILTGGVRPA
jgi:BirA family transcriptional regulator, biotin operon repressor / biotin---[acetyl-CoA-carboxylase] ligase